MSGGLEFWLVKHTSTYENYESNVFKIIKCLCEISNHWPNDLWETNVYKSLIIDNIKME